MIHPKILMQFNRASDTILYSTLHKSEEDEEEELQSEDMATQSDNNNSNNAEFDSTTTQQNENEANYAAFALRLAYWNYAMGALALLNFDTNFGNECLEYGIVLLAISFSY